MLAWSAFVLILMCWSLAITDFSGEILPLAFAVPFLYALYSVNACLLPYVLNRMLDDISKGRTPFTMKNANRLVFLAIILLLYVVFETLLSTVDSHFVLTLESSSVEVGNFVQIGRASCRERV